MHVYVKQTGREMKNDTWDTHCSWVAALINNSMWSPEERSVLQVSYSKVNRSKGTISYFSDDSGLSTTLRDWQVINMWSVSSWCRLSIAVSCRVTWFSQMTRINGSWQHILTDCLKHRDLFTAPMEYIISPKLKKKRVTRVPCMVTLKLSSASWTERHWLWSCSSLPDVISQQGLFNIFLLRCKDFRETWDLTRMC